MSAEAPRPVQHRWHARCPVTNGTNDIAPTQPTNDRRRVVIHAWCSVHRGAVGFTNLLVSNRNGDIELDPHLTGACVLRLDEDGAGALRDALIEWLG